MLEKLRSVHRGLYSPSTIDTELYQQLTNAVREVASPVLDFHGQGHFNVSFDNTSAMHCWLHDYKLYKEQRISKDHVLITIAATWEGEFILDNSQGAPIGEGHDDDIFAAIHGHLDSGDFDEQDANDEAICELDLTQVHSEEEPDLPPLPPASPPVGRRAYLPQRIIDSWI
ncbi:hypothetical protein E4U52_007427 [Claviceps spartinae]|nr:hypothetical protein E4U52_007427 [Claviceps spartinae]